MTRNRKCDDYDSNQNNINHGNQNWYLEAEKEMISSTPTY